MPESVLHDRLTRAAGDRTYRALAELTGANAETCRRYMQGQSPSADFLTAFCAALGVSGDWLLTGQGPMRVADARAHALRQADPGELLSAMANTLESLSGRLERLEVFVQTLETRLRATAMPSSDNPGQTPPTPGTVRAGDTNPRADGGAGHGGDGQVSVDPGSSVERVARAIARRPPPPAD